MKFEIKIPVAELKTVLPGLSKIVPRSGGLPALWLPGTSPSSAAELLVLFDELGKVIKGCTAGQSIRLLSDSKETRIAVALRGNFVEQTIPTIDVKEWPPLIKVEKQAPIPHQKRRFHRKKQKTLFIRKKSERNPQKARIHGRMKNHDKIISNGTESEECFPTCWLPEFPGWPGQVANGKSPQPTGREVCPTIMAKAVFKPLSLNQQNGISARTFSQTMHRWNQVAHLRGVSLKNS
jgi:hypothetical protein